MGDPCCGGCGATFEPNTLARRNVLVAVLLINAVMFAGELGAGLWAHSSALQADSVDMLMDALVYAFSLFALNRTSLARARTGLLSGVLELLLAGGVLAELGRQVLAGTHPIGLLMMVVSAIAFAANALSGALLMRFRREDINMRAVWLCTRNDAIGNLATLAAGAWVLGMGTPWPDRIVGALIALLFVRTSLGVMHEAWAEMKEAVPAH